MSFHHLVNAPKPWNGGVFFTVDEIDLDQFIYVSPAALDRLEPSATTDWDRVRYVMLNLGILVDAAERKSCGYNVPELIVLGPQDFAG